MKSAIATSIVAALQLSRNAHAYTVPKCSGVPSVSYGSRESPSVCSADDVSLTSINDSGVCDEAAIFNFAFGICCDSFETSLTEESYREITLPQTQAEECSTQMFLNITEWLPPNLDACCKSCKCYGDPHCRAFNGDSDTWVTCDTRVNIGDPSKGQCKGTNRETTEHKNECYGIGSVFHKENSQSKCKYNAGTWNWSYRGSRCQINPNWNPTMTMYQDKTTIPGWFQLDAIMGERGVIDKVKVYMDHDDESGWGTELQLYAKGGSASCNYWTDYQGNEYAKSLGNLPEGFSSQILTNPDTDAQDVYWVIERADDNFPIVKIHCMGYQFSRTRIDRRINLKVDQTEGIIDQLTADDGFCVRGTIEEGPSIGKMFCATEGMPEYDEWDNFCADLTKQYCKGSYPKNMAEFNQLWGSPSESLDMIKIFKLCAKRWCEGRQLRSGDGTSLEECVDDVADFKWLAARRLYPELTGTELGTTTGECVDYVFNSTKPEECEDGIELWIEIEGVKSPYAWIPIGNYCPIQFNRDEHPDLFEGQVTMRQYKCNELGQRCDSWSELSGSMSYTSSCYEIKALLDSGDLEIREKGSGDVVDFKWTECNPVEV